jgi:septum site-determining protein MinC
MPRKAYVVLKGRPDGIDIILDAQAEFETIKRHMQKKIAGAKHFFDGANASITFSGRSLSEKEEKKLLDIIFADSRASVRLADAGGWEVSVPYEKEMAVFAVDTVPVPVVVETGMPGALSNYTEHLTAYYNTGLRSGQAIRYDGSVVVMGDANPGSEIVAHGNVIVLGSLKGMVHAGAGGDENCYVSALSLYPIQLRIAGIITYFPPETIVPRRQDAKPSCAYIQNGQVYIAPLVN